MRKASKKDKKLVSDILVSAFLPLKEANSINFVVKQDAKRIERMYVLMAFLFEKAISFGEVYIADNNKACVLLKYPHKEKTTLKMFFLTIRLVFKCIGIRRVFKVLRREQVAEKNYGKEKHIRPMIMGVYKEWEGKGTAARLMLEIKKKYKGNHLPVLINSASDRNTLLYQKFGFKIIKRDASLGFPITFLKLTNT